MPKFAGRYRRGPLVLAVALAAMVGDASHPYAMPPGLAVDPPPILTSLGVTNDDGSPLGVVGGAESFRLEAPPGKAFRAVHWRITGAFAKQEFSPDEGFINTPFPVPMIDRPEGGATVSEVRFYYGVGEKTGIGVLAHYTDGTTGRPAGFTPRSRD